MNKILSKTRAELNDYTCIDDGLRDWNLMGGYCPHCGSEIINGLDEGNQFHNEDSCADQMNLMAVKCWMSELIKTNKNK